MASYDYKCDTDDCWITVYRGMTAPEVIPNCDTCNEPMKRIYNAAPVKFKGTGFYSTGG